MMSTTSHRSQARKSPMSKGVGPQHVCNGKARGTRWPKKDGTKVWVAAEDMSAARAFGGPLLARLGLTYHYTPNSTRPCSH